MEESKLETSQPLMGGDGDDGVTSKDTTPPTVPVTRQAPSRRHVPSVLRYAGLVAFSALIVWGLTSLGVLEVKPGPRWRSSMQSLPSLPTTLDGISWVTMPTWKRQHSAFVDGTEAEIDKAWKELLIGQNVRASREEMVRANNSLDNSVELAEGGYVGMLGVYHSIHCLQVVREMLASRDPSRADVSDMGPFSSGYLHHSYHCLDFVLDAVKCKADLTLYRFEWIKDYHEEHNKVIQSDSSYQCVDWDAVERWARPRALKEGEFLVLANTKKDFDGR